MCNKNCSSTCTCTCQKITLERDKVYKTRKGEKIRVVCTDMLNPNGKVIYGLRAFNGPSGPSEQGTTYRPDGTGPALPEDHIVSEWKEPVIHTRVVVWFLNRLGNINSVMFLGSTEASDYIKMCNFCEIKRETIRYTEE